MQKKNEIKSMANLCSVNGNSGKQCLRFEDNRPHNAGEHKPTKNPFQAIEKKPSSTIEVLKQFADFNGMANQVVQLKLISDEKLNVVGEEHDKSDKRRLQERKIAQTDAKGGYWEEDQFTFLDKAESKIRFGDDPVLRAEQGWTKINEYLSLLRKLSKIQSDSKQNKDAAAKKQFEYIYSYRFILSQQDQSLVELDPKGEIIASAINKAMQMVQNHSKNNEIEWSQLNKDLEAFSSLELEKTEELGNSDGMVAYDRSGIMNNSAQSAHSTLGIWKVGDNHTSDMEHLEDNRLYNLVSKDDFNEEYFNTDDEEPELERTRSYTDSELALYAAKNRELNDDDTDPAASTSITESSQGSFAGTTSTQFMVKNNLKNKVLQRQKLSNHIALDKLNVVGEKHSDWDDNDLLMQEQFCQTYGLGRKPFQENELTASQDGQKFEDEGDDSRLRVATLIKAMFVTPYSDDWGFYIDKLNTIKTDIGYAERRRTGWITSKNFIELKTKVPILLNDFRQKCNALREISPEEFENLAELENYISKEWKKDGADLMFPAYARSLHMHWFAQKYGTKLKAIWRVGNDHVMDMSNDKIFPPTSNYQLLDRLTFIGVIKKSMHQDPKKINF